jgi:pimeloyl-ACP methyl ester carboxylesterase
MTLTDRTVKLGALAFHYTEWGPPAAPAVILLHGITGHARVWDTLARALAPDFRVLALDQRGHGDSEAPADDDYRVATMAADLTAFADALGLARFALIGHSMGGRVAMAFAGDHGERLTRLVIVDIGPDIHPGGLERVRQMMAHAPETLESEEWAVRYVRLGNPLYDEAELRHRVVQGLRRRPDGTLTWKYSKGLRDLMRAGGRRDVIDLWAPLRRTACPALVVRGSESDIITAEQAKQVVAALPAGQLVEIAGAGHTVPGDKPAEFARAVRAFLLG